MNRSGHSRPASKLPGTPLKFGRHAYTDLLLAEGYAVNRGAGGRGGPGNANAARHILWDQDRCAH
jgi:hypothetical protein